MTMINPITYVKDNKTHNEPFHNPCGRRENWQLDAGSWLNCDQRTVLPREACSIPIPI